MTVSAFILSRFSWQHCDLGAGLLNELLQVNLPQLLGQLLQLVLHVLQWHSMTEWIFRWHDALPAASMWETSTVYEIVSLFCTISNRFWCLKKETTSNWLGFSRWFCGQMLICIVHEWSFSLHHRVRLFLSVILTNRVTNSVIIYYQPSFYLFFNDKIIYSSISFSKSLPLPSKNNCNNLI